MEHRSKSPVTPPSSRRSVSSADCYPTAEQSLFYDSFTPLDDHEPDPQVTPRAAVNRTSHFNFNVGPIPNFSLDSDEDEDRGGEWRNYFNDDGDCSGVYIDSSITSQSDSAFDASPDIRILRRAKPLEIDHKRVNATETQLFDSVRCVIEHTGPENALEYAHVLRLSVPEDEVTKLEYAWNLEYGRLNLNSRYNIFHMEPKFHSLFDKGVFFLLPDYDVVQKMREPHLGDRLKRLHSPESVPKVFSYNLIPRKEMTTVPIHRQRKMYTDEAPRSEDFEHFRFPYEDIQVDTHVHPCFVVADAGQV